MTTRKGNGANDTYGLSSSRRDGDEQRCGAFMGMLFIDAFDAAQFEVKDEASFPLSHRRL
jgi:hypothetical protein